MPITLPTTPLPATRINPRILLFYGAPKVGKTTVITQLKEPYLLLELEAGGADYVAATKVQVNSIYEYIEVLKAIREPNAPKYKFGIIDTVDKLEEWCEEVATKRYRETTIGKNFTGRSVLELDRGAGYLWLRMAFKEYFTMATQCFEHTIFIGHIRDKLLIAGDKVLMPDGTFKPVSNEGLSNRDLDLTGKVRSIACSQADAIGHMYRDGANNLCINFVSGESVNCGSRCLHLRAANIQFDWSKIYI